MSNESRDWRDDLSWSQRIFGDQVWPILMGKEFLNGGNYISVETDTSEILRNQLDILCGVDIFQITGGAMRGIASRVQRMRKGEKPFNSFTLRYDRGNGRPTEYQKRLRAIFEEPEEGWLYPYWTCQAYMDYKNDGHLLSLALIETKELILFVSCHPDSVEVQTSNAVFLVVYWEIMKDCGVPIKVYYAEEWDKWPAPDFERGGYWTYSDYLNN